MSLRQLTKNHSDYLVKYDEDGKAQVRTRKFFKLQQPDWPIKVGSKYEVQYGNISETATAEVLDSGEYAAMKKKCDDINKSSKVKSVVRKRKRTVESPLSEPQENISKKTKQKASTRKVTKKAAQELELVTASQETRRDTVLTQQNEQDCDRQEHSQEHIVCIEKPQDQPTPEYTEPHSQEHILPSVTQNPQDQPNQKTPEYTGPQTTWQLTSETNVDHQQFHPNDWHDDFFNSPSRTYTMLEPIINMQTPTNRNLISTSAQTPENPQKCNCNIRVVELLKEADRNNNKKFAQLHKKMIDLEISHRLVLGELRKLVALSSQTSGPNTNEISEGVHVNDNYTNGDSDDPFQSIPHPHYMSKDRVKMILTNSHGPGNFAKNVFEKLFPELFTPENMRLQYSYYGGGSKNKKEVDPVRKSYLEKFVLYFHPELRPSEGWRNIVVQKINECLRRKIKP